MVFRILMTGACLAWSVAPASAQSFEEVFAAAQQDVGDIAKYQQALQNPDQRLQYSLVQQMLKLPDPALQRIAKEHALFSTNPVMREAAIKAILDSQATLRVQIAGSQDDTPFIQRHIRSQGGTFASGQGTALITVPEAVNDACWGSTRSCIFKQVGNTIQYTPGGYVTGVLTLGNDGVMRGAIEFSQNSTREVVQAQIDLKE